MALIDSFRRRNRAAAVLDILRNNGVTERGAKTGLSREEAINIVEAALIDAEERTLTRLAEAFEGETVWSCSGNRLAEMIRGMATPAHTRAA
jgi:hypothetical protein